MVGRRRRRVPSRLAWSRQSLNLPLHSCSFLSLFSFFVTTLLIQCHFFFPSCRVGATVLLFLSLTCTSLPPVGGLVLLLFKVVERRTGGRTDSSSVAGSKKDFFFSSLFLQASPLTGRLLISINHQLSAVVTPPTSPPHTTLATLSLNKL